MSEDRRVSRVKDSTVVVSVEPDARRERLVEISPTTFQISVKEPAQRNRANQRVRELLAEHFGVTLSSVQILTGARSGKKRFTVRSKA